MDQHRFGRPASTHTDDAQHCHSGERVSIGKAGQSWRCGGHSKHFSPGQPPFESAAIAVCRVQSECKRDHAAENSKRISDMDQNLPTLLQSAHISNALLSARISTAVNLILSTVNNFAALMPSCTAVCANDRPQVDNGTTEPGAVVAAVEPASMRGQQK